MRGFWEELRHRNVIRVGIAYVVACWLVAQVADLAADAFNAPDWFMQMLIVVLAPGFPIALIFAWAFELTPEGLKKAKDLPADMPKDPRSGKILNRATIIGLVAAVAWLGWDEIRDVTTGPAEDVVDKSIAVLPFDDFSPDGDQVWFADGLTEEILNSLARIGDLHVASRTSTFAFRDSDQSATEIADELGVAHILEGSVRRAGNQLRVTAQLIRASDDKHLWSDTFDGDIDNSISIQEEIATNIATALQTAMNPEELERMISAGTASVEAWELYLQAMAMRNEDFERLDMSRVFETLDILDQAVAIDPDFVHAHEQLRNALYTQLDNSTVSYSDAGPPYEERRERFDRALEATIRLARSDIERLEAENMKANIEVRLDEQLRIAEQLAALAPDDPDHFRDAAALYRMTGQPDKAYESMEQFWSLADARVDRFDSLFIYEARRIDLKKTVDKIEALLAEIDVRGEDMQALFYYQAHRAFLDAGELERAADMIDAYKPALG